MVASLTSDTEWQNELCAKLEKIQGCNKNEENRLLRYKETIFLKTIN
ncbi:DUF7667 family protein [Brevibacillus laterosporus]